MFLNKKNFIGTKLIARNGHIEIDLAGNTTVHNRGGMIHVTPPKPGRQINKQIDKPVKIQKKDIREITSIFSSDVISSRVVVRDKMTTFTSKNTKTGEEEIVPVKTSEPEVNMNAVKSLVETSREASKLIFDIAKLKKLVDAAASFTEKDNRLKTVKIGLRDGMLSIISENESNGQKFSAMLMNMKQ